MLVFEDIHWADANLLDLIDALATRARRCRSCSSRSPGPSSSTRAPAGEPGSPSYTALTLGPLDEDDARELAVRRLGDGDRADAVVRIAEGNPLFIEQLAASIGETATGALPTSIRGIVAARLDALPPRRARAAARRRRRRQGLLARRTAGAQPESATSTRLLDELERRDLSAARPSSIIEGQQQFAFTHVLIRDVAYDLLPRADRARRHAAVAPSSSRRSTGVVGRGDRRDRPPLARRRRLRTRGRRSSSAAAEQAERGWAKDHAAFLYREALAARPRADDTRAAERAPAPARAREHGVLPPDDVRRQESPPA